MLKMTRPASTQIKNILAAILAVATIDYDATFF